MVVTSAVVKGIKAVAVEAVAFVDVGVLGDVDVVEAMDTREGDVTEVGGETPLSSSMVLIYHTTTIFSMNSNK